MCKALRGVSADELAYARPRTPIDCHGVVSSPVALALGLVVSCVRVCVRACMRGCAAPLAALTPTAAVWLLTPICSSWDRPQMPASDYLCAHIMRGLAHSKAGNKMIIILFSSSNYWYPLSLLLITITTTVKLRVNETKKSNYSNRSWIIVNGAPSRYLWVIEKYIIQLEFVF